MNMLDDSFQAGLKVLPPTPSAKVTLFTSRLAAIAGIANYRNSSTGILQERTISVVVLPTIIVRRGLWP